MAGFLLMDELVAVFAEPLATVGAPHVQLRLLLALVALFRARGLRGAITYKHEEKDQTNG